MSHGVTVVRAIVCLKNGLISLRILNPRNCSIPLKKGTAFARMEHIKGPVVNLSAVRGTDISTAAQETLLFLGVEAAPIWAERPFFDITLIQVTKPLFISLHDACPKHEEKKCVAFCEKCWKVESSNFQMDHGHPQSSSHRKRMGPSASSWCLSRTHLRMVQTMVEKALEEERAKTTSRLQSSSEKMQFIQDNMMLSRSDKSERDEEDAEWKATQGTERDTFVVEEDDVATEQVPLLATPGLDKDNKTDASFKATELEVVIY
ncbi:hypothetical protein EMCRGX_G005903 [Ephydatia muelleri]